MTCRQHAMTPPDELDRLPFHMRRFARGSANEWATGFPCSILHRAKRPSWRSGNRQLSAMMRLVGDPFALSGDETDELILIEE